MALANAGAKLREPVVVLIDAIGDGRRCHDPVTLKAVRSEPTLRSLYRESESLSRLGDVFYEHCPHLATVTVMSGARSVDFLMGEGPHGRGIFAEVSQSLRAKDIQVTQLVPKVLYPGQYAGPIPLAIEVSRGVPKQTLDERSACDHLDSHAEGDRKSRARGQRPGLRWKAELGRGRPPRVRGRADSRKYHPVRTV